MADDEDTDELAEVRKLKHMSTTLDKLKKGLQQSTRPSGRAMEHFNKARRTLMAPFHQDDENYGFYHALVSCHTAVDAMKDEPVDLGVEEYLEAVRGALDIDGLEDPDDGGLLMVKARNMTRDEKEKFSHAVDTLATAFTIGYFSNE
jgi:hypothetical protein